MDGRNRFEAPQAFVGTTPELETAGIVSVAFPLLDGQSEHRASMSFINQGAVGGNIYLDIDGRFKIKVARLYDSPIATGPTADRV